MTKSGMKVTQTFTAMDGAKIHLTARVRTIIDALREGLSNPEIAERLDLAAHSRRSGTK